MTDERGDEGTRRVLEELLDAPVGRRWFLQAGAGAAAAAAAVLYGGPAVAVAEAEAAKPKGKTKRVEHSDLHFALGQVRGVHRLTLEVNGQRAPSAPSQRPVAGGAPAPGRGVAADGRARVDALRAGGVVAQ